MTEELVTYKGIQQVSKYTEDNESKASHGEGSYIHNRAFSWVKSMGLGIPLAGSTISFSSDLLYDIGYAIYLFCAQVLKIV